MRFLYCKDCSELEGNEVSDGEVCASRWLVLERGIQPITIIFLAHDLVDSSGMRASIAKLNSQCVFLKHITHFTMNLSSSCQKLR